MLLQIKIILQWDKYGKSPRIQTLNSNLIDQSQVSVYQQEPRIQKRQIYSCQGLSNTESPNKLKKFEEPHKQNIIQLYSLIEKMNTEIQTLKAENQNLKVLLQDKKKEDKGQVSQVQFQIEALTSKFVLIEKNLASNPQKIEEEIELQIKKYQPQADKMEIEQKNQTQ